MKPSDIQHMVCAGCEEGSRLVEQTDELNARLLGVIDSAYAQLTLTMDDDPRLLLVDPERRDLVIAAHEAFAKENAESFRQRSFKRLGCVGCIGPGLDGRCLAKVLPLG